MMTSLAKTIVSANGFVELEYFGGNILNYLYIIPLEIQFSYNNKSLLHHHCISK